MQYETDYGGVWDAQKALALTQKELSALAFEYNVYGGGKIAELRARVLPLLIDKQAKILIVTRTMRNTRMILKSRAKGTPAEKAARQKRETQKQKERRKKPKQSDAQTKAKKLQDERTAWKFFEQTLNKPLDAVDSLPPALSGQKAAYSALLPAQKAHLSSVLLPLLLARQVELTGYAEAIDANFDANTWLRIMCALSTFDDAKRTDSNDCCISTHPVIHPHSKRPRFRNYQTNERSATTNLAVFAAILVHGLPPPVVLKGKKQLPDCSHLCKNKFCVAPRHLVFEERKQNQRREGCGNAFECRHEQARCIWVRRGRFLPCRNDEKRSNQVCDDGCDKECFNFDLDKLIEDEELGDDNQTLDEQEDGDTLDEQEARDTLDSSIEEEDAEDLESQPEDEEPTTKHARLD